MSGILVILGIIGGTGIVGYLLGKIPDGTINTFVGKPSFAVGAAFTLLMNKITMGIWNKAIEPFFKKVLNAIVVNFLLGMDSDNNEKSKYGNGG